MRKFIQWTVRLALFGLVALAVYDQLVRRPEFRTWHGNVFGIPYDFRPPTVERILERFWNPNDDRLLTPHVFGVGWSINFHRLVRMRDM